MENKLLKIETIVKNDSLNKNFMREVMGGTTGDVPCLIDIIICNCHGETCHEDTCYLCYNSPCPSNSGCIDATPPTPVCPQKKN